MCFRLIGELKCLGIVRDEFGKITIDKEIDGCRVLVYR